MYHKITDGFSTFDKQKQEEEFLENEAQQLQLPMSYIVCPVCENVELEKCACEGGYNNYYCKKCSFQHINHHHKGFEKDGNPKHIKKIDNSILVKAVRK